MNIEPCLSVQKYHSSNQKEFPIVESICISQNRRDSNGDTVLDVTIFFSRSLNDKSTLFVFTMLNVKRFRLSQMDLAIQTYAYLDVRMANDPEWHYGSIVVEDTEEHSLYAVCENVNCEIRLRTN